MAGLVSVLGAACAGDVRHRESGAYGPIASPRSPRSSLGGGGVRAGSLPYGPPGEQPGRHALVPQTRRAVEGGKDSRTGSSVPRAGRRHAAPVVRRFLSFINSPTTGSGTSRLRAGAAEF